MGFVQQWVRQPQTVWLRRVLFQVHLWVGLAAGMYLLVISLSGSAVVFRRELSRSFLGPTPVAITGPRLPEATLRHAILRAYPGHQITQVQYGARPDVAATVSLQRPGPSEAVERKVDPYTGADLGPAIPPGHYVLEWFVDLHDNLLAGRTGRTVNGIGGALLALLCLTGFVIWWPGSRSWRRRLIAKPGSNWRLFNWELHGAMGFWSLAILFLWAVTGVYFGFAEAISAFQDSIDPNEDDFERPGDAMIALLVRWHFGRFGGLGVRVLWVLLGLLPAVLFVTGGIMWWNRVLRDRRTPVTSPDLSRQAVASRPR